jgi:hypothetical protein
MLTDTLGQITIDGRGVNPTLSGNHRTSVFQVSANVTAQILGLNIANGQGGYGRRRLQLRHAHSGQLQCHEQLRDLRRRHRQLGLAPRPAGYGSVIESA